MRRAGFAFDCHALLLGFFAMPALSLRFADAAGARLRAL